MHIIEYYDVDSEINTGKIIYLLFYPIFSILLIIFILYHKKIKEYKYLIYILLILFIGSFIGTVIGLYNILKNTEYINSFNSNIITGTYQLLIGYILLIIMILYIKYKKNEIKSDNKKYIISTSSDVIDIFYTDLIATILGLTSTGLIIAGNVFILYIPK
jgi:hypothetical protein